MPDRSGRGAHRARDAVTGASAPKPDTVSLGRTLRMARSGAGYSQSEAARRLGVTRVTMHNWESGKSRPSEENLAAAAELYRTTSEVLLEVALTGDHDGAAGVAAFAPVIPRALPQRVREWVYEFLSELVRGGATDAEVEDARLLLTAPQVTGYLVGGVGRIASLSEDEIIEGLQAIGEHAIKRVLRARGRNV